MLQTSKLSNVLVMLHEHEKRSSICEGRLKLVREKEDYVKDIPVVMYCGGGSFQCIKKA